MSTDKSIITEKEVLEFKNIFDKCLNSYEQKGDATSDKEWLTQLFCNENSNNENAIAIADEIVTSLKRFQKNMAGLNDAELQGQSKESWLASKIKEHIKGFPVTEQNKILTMTNEALIETNIQISDKLSKNENDSFNSIIDINPIVEEELYDSMQESNQIQMDAIAKSIGKNINALALQNATIVTGTKIVNDILMGENIEPKKLVVNAFQTGIDNSLKVIAAGALQVAVDNDIISALPEKTVPNVVASIAAMGIENSKILYKISSREITISEGLNSMGKVAITMFLNLFHNVRGTSISHYLARFIPVLGPVGTIIADIVGTLVSFSGKKKLGELIYNTKIRVAKIAKNVAKIAIQGIKEAGNYLKTKIKQTVNRVREIFS